ncbi:MAG: hypothetical protein P8Q27_00200 [Flavicella sp.]|nr:hypothetical protein [Flavicella sp.]
MRKEFAALFFYCLYLLAMLRPLLPVLEYSANQAHIVAVLCENRERPALACNGKCYLKKQLQKNLSAQHSDDKHQHQKSAAQIDFSKYPVAPVSHETIVIACPKRATNKEWNNPSWESSTYFASLLRPPIPFSFLV